MGNKLFCSFIHLDNIDNFINALYNSYTINYKKIFLFHLKEEEYFCTYNMDVHNMNRIPENTILIHRKKETNTLYTINALNLLIKTLNNNVLDKTYLIPWDKYKNNLLLIQDGLYIQSFKLFKILNNGI